MHEFPLSLCTVMLVELSTPAGEPPVDPAVLKRVIHELVGKALRGLPENTRMAVESAGTAVICFMGDPEEALHSGLLLRDLVAQRYAGKVGMRIALHLGPVRVVANRHDQVTVNGDGVQQAVQVKARGGPSELMVSTTYHELLTRLNPDTADLFQYHGPTNEQPIEVYSVVPALGIPQRDPLASFVVTRPAPLMDGSLLDPESVQDIESELAGYIGPLAHVLVRKSRGRAQSLQGLREILSAAIQNPRTRDFFLAGKLGQTVSPLPEQRLPPAPAPRPDSPPAGARPAGRADATRQLDIAPAELAIIEHTLQRFIGPLAQPLMLREIDVCGQFADFVQAVAGSIGHPQQRSVFLQALQRALPERTI